MAIRTKRVTGGNGINYTKELDGPSDWTSVVNNTYFKDLSDGLIYWKDTVGAVIAIYELGGLSALTNADNGLNVVSGFTVELGGTLNKTTTIDAGGTEAMNFGGATSSSAENVTQFNVHAQSFYLDSLTTYDGLGSGMSFLMNPGGMQFTNGIHPVWATQIAHNPDNISFRVTNSGATLISELKVDDSFAKISFNDNSSGGTLNLTSTGHTFTDTTAAQAGIQYAADYSATFVNESLITKQYFTDNHNYTTGSTLIGNSIYFDRNDTLSAYTVDISSVNSGDTFTTGSTFVNSGLPNSTDTIYYDRNDALSAYTTNVTTVYDSGWKSLNSIKTVGGDTFGLAAVTAWTNPYIRVVDRTVYINGNFLIPLAQNGSASTLRTPWTTGATPSYQELWKTDTQTYNGTGGFLINSNGSLTSKTSIVPTELRSTHPLLTIGRSQPAARSISDGDLKADGSTGGAGVIICDTILNSIYLNSDGKLVITVHSDLDDSVGVRINNSIYHKLITRAASGESVPTYGANLHSSLSGNYKNSFQELVSGGTLTFGREYTITNYNSGDDFINVGGINATNATFFATGTTPTTFTGSTLTSDNRLVTSSGLLYPTDINGEDEDKLGGYYFMLDFSYPLSASYTDAQIKAAWDSI